MVEPNPIERRLLRERAARKAAESLLELKSRELYEANQHLTSLAEQLRDQAEQTKAIVEAAAEGIITYDQNGAILLFNRSARKIFGLQSAVGINVRTLFENTELIEMALFPSNVCFIPNADPVDSELVINEAVECVGLRNTTEPFAAEIATSRTLYGHTIIFTALVRDLSKRKRLEARLRQAQKMESVGQLAAGIAHEINTPIQYVGDNLRFMQEAFVELESLIDLFEDLSHAAVNGESVDRYVQRIRKHRQGTDIGFLKQEFPVAISQSRDGIERVANIVRAMKEFSLPSSDALSATDVNQSIKNSLTVLANRLRDQIRVQTAFETGLPLMLCLAGQLNQALLNILSNAIEAITESSTPGEGVIAISTHRQADSIEIRISDNGPGIPAAIQPRIFDPFFTTKEVGKGSGQGLAFVYDVIVNKHQGAIHVVSPVSGGTTFVISLPISDHLSSKGREHAVSFG